MIMQKKRIKDINDDTLEEFELNVSETETEIAPRQKEKRKRSGQSAPWYYLGLIGEIGFAIAVPIAGGTLGGVLLDRMWSTTPKATLSLLLIGVIVSFFNLYKTVQTIVKEK